ncbi:AI-2 transport protein TqsA [Planctomycetes bacterium CA13]|uniref:AI-2 transport protein TqsA n=1 Tax=Novipirellula herctigrandis TaxID=2527986 RepID=A0A5C5YX43_9BACT|nr:AI-2 transport protein TqsA [Planctomycetes bacterium CA13]
MESQKSYPSIETVCLAVIATAVSTYMIYWLRPVLVPFVVALFVVSGITPLLETLEKRLGVNRLIAAAITFLLGLAMMVVLGLCLWLSVVQMADKGDAYRNRVNELIVSIEKQIELTFAKPNWAEIEETGSEANSERLPNQTSVHIEKPKGRPIGQSLENLQQTVDEFLRNGLARLSSELFNLATTSVVVLIYVFFLLLGSADVHRTSAPIHRINTQVRSYLSLKTIISIITGGVFGITLWLFGVPMSLTFGVLAFLLNYIPNVGPIVATLLPIPFILLHPDGTFGWMFAAIGTTSAIQILSGNLIEPKLMGKSSDLHPVVILFALMFWGMMWGITGMFLATPITAGIKIALESFQATKPISSMLAGRWGDT